MAMIELDKPYDFGTTLYPDTSALINRLIQSNNEQEERIRKLEDNKQTISVDPRFMLPLQFGCNCEKPMTGLGSKNCLHCGLVLVSQVHQA
jgi:hypothetical protein